MNEVKWYRVTNEWGIKDDEAGFPTAICKPTIANPPSNLIRTNMERTLRQVCDNELGRGVYTINKVTNQDQYQLTSRHF